MKLIKDTIKLNKEIVTSQDSSHNADLTYVGLRMIMSRDILGVDGDSAIDVVSPVRIAYQLNKSEEIENSY